MMNLTRTAVTAAFFCSALYASEALLPFVSAHETAGDVVESNTRGRTPADASQGRARSSQKATGFKPVCLQVSGVRHAEPVTYGRDEVGDLAGRIKGRLEL